MVQPLWRIVWRFLKKIKIELPSDPAIPVPGIYPEKKQKTLIQKDACTPVFIAALFTIAKTWKQHKCSSIDEWIKKIWCIHTHTDTHTHTHTHTHNGILLSHKKNEIMSFAAIWMDLEIIILSEASQTEKGKYMVSLYMWNLKK